MAKEWYLMSETKPSYISGFESDELDTSVFEETLDTEFSYDIEIYNRDLTFKCDTKAIMEDNILDTSLKTTRRNVLIPIGVAHCGEYVKYKNRYWLITGLVDDNMVYAKLIISLCNYCLTWLNQKGEIVQRWVVANNASQYNNGETKAQHYFYIRTDQLMILSPDDDECLLLKNGQRFIVDRRCDIYEKDISEDVTVSTDYTLNIYRLTRSDNVVFDFQDEGYLQFMVYQDEKKDTDGFYRIDGKGYWLCDPKLNGFNSPSQLKSEIIPDTDFSVYCGIGEPSIFSARFISEDGAIASVEPIWTINSTFNDKIIVEQYGDYISILVDDIKLANKKFDISLQADGYEIVTKTIVIKSFQ